VDLERGHDSSRTTQAASTRAQSTTSASATCRQLARAHELRFDALSARGEYKEAAAAKALELMRPALS